MDLTGISRYDLLEDFYDISNTNVDRPGHMNWYPFGQTFVDPGPGGSMPFSRREVLHPPEVPLLMRADPYADLVPIQEAGIGPGMIWRAILRLLGRGAPVARSATALTQRGIETARRIADAERIIAQATTSPAMRAFAQGQLRALQRTMAEINAELARRGAPRIEVPIMSP